jgi:uncharacterized membrane protein SpoIIM required for sporulation
MSKINRSFVSAFIISFSCWLLSFAIRLFLIEDSAIKIDQLNNNALISNVTVNEIVQLLSNNNKKDAFMMIFLNNMKGCLLNIVSGVMFGFGTVINLLINGGIIQPTYLCPHIKKDYALSPY